MEEKELTAELLQDEYVEGCHDVCTKCVYEDLIPIDTSTVEDGALNIEEFDKGTDDASWYIGFYSACVNAGMDLETTFTVMQMEFNKQLMNIQGGYDLELAKYQEQKHPQVIQV